MRVFWLIPILLGQLLNARVIVVSVDGMRPDAVTILGAERLPNFYRLRAEGSFTDNARTDFHFTNTLPNHTSMITSRPVQGPCGHGLTVNAGNSNLHTQGYKAGMFDVAHDHGLSTALFSTKSKFATFDGSYDAENGAPDLVGEDNGRDKIDVFNFDFRDESSVDLYLNQMASNLWDLSMLHISLPDSAGHSSDWNVEPGSNYMNSIITVDGYLGQVFQMIDDSSELAGSTHFIVITDHGGTFGTRTHTDPLIPTNYTIPFYIWGPGVKAGGDLYELNPDFRDPGTGRPELNAIHPPIRNSMIGNLALNLLGLPAIPGSCANRSQQLRVNDPPNFTSLYPDLSPTEDANGNGQSNFFDYAIGANPIGTDRPALSPRFTPAGLLVHQRMNVTDVTAAYEISADLIRWAPLLRDATYLSISSEESSNGRWLLLQVPTFARHAYFRQVFERSE